MTDGIPNFTADDPASCETIEVGDMVRSYDFERHTDCYIEGMVTAIGVEVEGCPRYRISVMLRVFDGKQRVEEGEIFPPVNGTRKMMGGYCNGVRKVAS